VERSSYRYEPRPERHAALREDLVKLARQKPRYGYRRLHALLSLRGHEVNVKRVYRCMCKRVSRCGDASASGWCGIAQRSRD
jgi:hypothetical protein